MENKPTSSPNTVPFSLPGSLFGRKKQAILLNINPNHLRFLFLHAHGTRPAPPSPNSTVLSRNARARARLAWPTHANRVAVIDGRRRSCAADASGQNRIVALFASCPVLSFYIISIFLVYDTQVYNSLKDRTTILYQNYRLIISENLLIT